MNKLNMNELRVVEAGVAVAADHYSVPNLFYAGYSIDPDAAIWFKVGFGSSEDNIASLSLTKGDGTFTYMFMPNLPIWNIKFTLFGASLLNQTNQDLLNKLDLSSLFA